MKSLHIIFLLLILSSCTSKKPLSNCESTNYHGIGLKPIELLREDNVIRVWIDRSSSILEVLTIVYDTSGNYAEIVEVGHVYKTRLLGKEKEFEVYTEQQTCPINGWDEFLNELEKLELGKLKTRKNDPSKDGIMMHHPMSQYLIEIKKDGIVQRFEFYSFYPDQHFPADMASYKKVEKLLLLSFEPLLKRLKFEQEYYKSLGPFEY